MNMKHDIIKLEKEEYMEEVEVFEKGSPQYDQLMQVTIMSYVMHLERGGEVDEEFEKEIHEYYGITDNKDKV